MVSIWELFKMLGNRFQIFLLLPLLVASNAPAGNADEYMEPRPQEDRFFTVILGEEDQADYESRAGEERTEWRRRHWALLDPTPTTDVNEREMEHVKRVGEAIEKFRDKDGRFLWDERAQLWIRFGAPERIERLPAEVVPGEGLVPPREFWLYQDMLIWFADYLLQDFYEVAWDVAREHSPMGQADEDVLEDAGMIQDPNLFFRRGLDPFLEVNAFELDPTRARQMTETGFHRWEEVPEINLYDYHGGEEFHFVFDISSLAGAAGKTDLLIGFLVPLSKIDFHTFEGEERAALQRRVALFDLDYRLVARSVESISHARDPLEPEGGWILTSDSLAVEPGDYHVALRVVDTRSQNHGLLKTEVNARDYNRDEVQISDLVFASAVTRDRRGDGAFLRGNYRIVPRPLRIFAPGEDVHVYFEIYHIRTGRSDRGLYEVQYTLFGLKPRRFVSFFGGSSKGKLEPGIAQTFRAESRGSTAHRHISLDTTSLPDDRYTLIVEVVDLNGRATDRAKGQFVVKR